LKVSNFYAELSRMQDAVLEPDLWTAIIHNLAEATGALGINIMAPTGRGAIGRVLHTDSLAEIMDAYLREEWNLRDHRAKFIPLMQRCGVVRETDFTTSDHLINLEYYKFMAKFGTRHTAVVNFSSGPDDLFFVLQRRLNDGAFDADDVIHFHALRQQLQTSARTMALFSESEIYGRLAAFERANLACVIFDRQGFVIATNGKANSLLEGDIRISNRKIKAWLPQETALFDAALARVIDSDASSTAGMKLSLKRACGRPVLAHIETAGSNLRDVFSRASVIVVLEDTDKTPSLSPTTIARMFDLTPMECTVALLLHKGLDAREVASHCGIGYETARSHIRSILRKTGTDRQAELCSLLGQIRLG
jgi:DNA-binding CsgD family transcriptional regulator